MAKGHDMKLIRTLLVSAAFVASAGANAAVIGELGGNNGNYLSLSSAGLNGGSVATLAGGTVYTSDQPFADIPAGFVHEGKFLAAGPTAGEPAVLSFNTSVNYLSFLWGSPDTYNQLKITSTEGVYDFTAQGLGFPSTSGDQNVSQYVKFNALGANERITSVAFSNNPSINAFESANFSISPVPEPATWGMMIAGFGLAGGAMRRRATKTRQAFA